ncbi:hypothetical protein IFM89_031950 [Coptis chinensis]|uniref:Cullin N-terminal domain-containing protein n=1 Tax=Coptis chinensis TaxID=261450 RepID=A0A835IYT7_9MAGN|nr:hypothetical protein IFM89_031950 [Coptis chinensis]
MAMHERKMIDLEQGWEFMQKGITKLKNILEGLPEPQFSSEDYMMLYTTIYNTCTHKPPHDYSQQLYDKYHKSFQEYITSTGERKCSIAISLIEITLSVSKERSSLLLLDYWFWFLLEPKSILVKEQENKLMDSENAIASLQHREGRIRVHGIGERSKD